MVESPSGLAALALIVVVVWLGMRLVRIRRERWIRKRRVDQQWRPYGRRLLLTMTLPDLLIAAVGVVYGLVWHQTAAVVLGAIVAVCTLDVTRRWWRPRQMPSWARQDPNAPIPSAWDILVHRHRRPGIGSPGDDSEQ